MSLFLICIAFMLTCKNSESEQFSETVRLPIFQSSTIDALLAGRYDGDFTIGQAKEHGNFGIGTFNALDGELVALDGNFYQVKTDGIPVLLSDSIQTPFITLDFFTGNDSVEIESGLDFEALSELLDDRIKKIHNIIAIKIKMSFDSLSLRSVPKQYPPYRPLVEVVGNQVFFKHYKISGTMVGFRFPDYLEGVNVPGYHFHFLSDDLKHGGHILNFSTTGGNAYIDSESEFYLSIPQDESFQSQNLAIDRTSELKKVESDK